MSKNELLILKQEEVKCEIHPDTTKESAITKLEPMKIHIGKQILFWLIVLLTGGVLLLLCYWVPNLHGKCVYKKCKVEKANNLRVSSRYYSDFVKLKKIQTKTKGELITFRFQELTYYYDKDQFFPLYFSTNMPYKNLITTFGKGYIEDEDILDMRKLYGKCEIVVPVMSYFRLIFIEILNPLCLFQIYSVILWYFEDYYIYAIAIMAITMFSLASSTVITRNVMLSLHRLANKECKVTVIRNNFVKMISSWELVPGDLIEISRDMEIPCDLCIISGTCVVEEGMLTGESAAVTKESASSISEKIYNPDECKRHTLYEGTKVIQTRNTKNLSVTAIVVRTGFNTAKGHIIRSILFSKPNKFRLYGDALKFIFFLSVLALLGFAINLPRMIYLQLESKEIILRVLDMVVIAVPPALLACLSVSVALAIYRLKKMQISCISPNKVNQAGGVNIMVFDKTGTLTEDGMNLVGVQGISGLRIKAVQPTPKGESRYFIECLATCHSLSIVNNEILGEDQEIQIFQSTECTYVIPDHIKYEESASAVVKHVIQKNSEDSDQAELLNEEVYEIKIIHTFLFTSRLKKMAVIVEDIKDSRFIFYIKGAPEVILENCYNVPDDIYEHLANYTMSGFRVLACAYKILHEFSSSYIKKAKIADLEEGMNFLGLIILKNKLKAKTSETLDLLNKAGIKSIMATGDAALTAISVGRECGMIDKAAPVYLAELDHSHIFWEVFDNCSSSRPSLSPPWTSNTSEPFILAFTGNAFDFIVRESESNQNNEFLKLTLTKGCIFARMSPENKTLLVQKLQSIGNLVGMCGDGTNDCGALKAADIGVSLGNADSSIAAPFTSHVTDISCVVTILKEGRCAITTTIQIFKYMALYSLIQFTSASLLYWNLGNLTNNQYLAIDLFTVMPLAVLMSMAGLYKELSKLQPPCELFSVEILSSVIIQSANQAIFQIFAYLVTVYVFFSAPDVVPGEHPDLATYENTVVFYVSWFECQIVCLLFAIGKPWKQPFYKNFLLSGYHVILCGMSIIALFYQNEIVKHLLNVNII